MDSSFAISPGVRKRSPAGRIASCASWAFLTLLAYRRGCAGTNRSPYSSRTCRRAASMADSDRFTESVRIYVMYPFSYSRWAVRIVCWDENRSFRAASCCRVEVMNGGAGDCLRSLRATLSTTYAPLLSAASIARACSSFATSAFFPSTLVSLARNGGGFSAASFAANVQYSTGRNALISSSRSTIIFMATDCTRPAERPRRTLSHSSGESL